MPTFVQGECAWLRCLVLLCGYLPPPPLSTFSPMSPFLDSYICTCNMDGHIKRLTLVSNLVDTNTFITLPTASLYFKLKAQTLTSYAAFRNPRTVDLDNIYIPQSCTTGKSPSIARVFSAKFLCAAPRCSVSSTVLSAFPFIAYSYSSPVAVPWTCSAQYLRRGRKSRILTSADAQC